MERLNARITGRVQGVGFRYWTRAMAERLSLTGWVMNGDDERSVELLAEGTPAALDQLERLLQRGPPGASVESVQVERGPASGSYPRFEVVRP